MGAQESSNKKKVEQIDIGEEYSKKSGAYRIWTHINPCTKNKKTQGTIFTKDYGGSADEKKYVENGVKYLKQLRHPSVLSFTNCQVTSDRLILMTERVQVLDLCIDSLSSIEIHSGLSQILDVLVFLHERAKVSHNNINPASIFVSSNGEWKLGGFEFAQPFSETVSHIQSAYYKKVGGSDYVPSEVSSHSMTYRDGYCFGKLLQYCLTFIHDDEIGKEVIVALEKHVNDLMKSEDKSNISLLSELSTSAAFENDLCSIYAFLNAIHLKTLPEKEDFFKTIVERMSLLPPRVVAKRLSRLILSRYVLLEPLSHIFLYPCFLTPKIDEDSDGIFPLELYRDYVITEVVRVFLVRETAVRLRILEHFDKYAEYIPVSQLEGFILDEVLRGAHDVDERLVSASLHAMAVLVPLLGVERVCGWKCTKTFVDGSPKVSTNSLSCSHITDRFIPPPPPSAARHLERDDEPFYLDNLKTPSTTEVPRFESIKDQHLSPMESSDDSWSNNDDEWNHKWEDDESTTADDVSINTIVAEPSTLSPPPPVTARRLSPVFDNKKSNGKIGSEFEIAVKKPVEEDFFADMEPEIKTKGTLIDQLIAMKEEEAKAKAQEAASKFLMKSDEVAVDYCGWGDEEEDWTSEDHSNNKNTPNDVISGDQHNASTVVATEQELTDSSNVP